MRKSKTFKRTLSLLLCLTMVFGAAPLAGLVGLKLPNITTTEAEAATDEYYSYEVSNGKATITDVDTSISGSITIPSTLGGYPVTSIGRYAFSGWTSLESITIPDSVTSIDEYAFYRCTSLTSITVDSNNKNYSSDEYGVLFNKNKTELIQYPFGNTRTSYTIPDSVTSIGKFAFNNCYSLESITFGENSQLTRIREYAFDGCTSLESVTFGENSQLTSIGSYAFSGCASLVSITIPDSVTSIGNYAFYDCTSLESVTIPDSVTRIGKSAFDGCTSLESVTIPDSVTSIGKFAFDGIESITVDSNNKNYSSDEYGVLFNKDKTELIQYPIEKTRTSFTIPDSVTSISEGAFSGCTSLASITFGENSQLTRIRDSAFYGCTSLERVTIPDSVTRIGEGTFSGCTNLESITFGENSQLTSIGDSAFYECTSLVSITIPNSVTSIGVRAFYGCTSLESVTIPDSVTSIGDSAFYNTAYYNKESNWENGVLYIGNHLIKAKNTVSGSYTIKDGTKTIADYAFYWCTSLESVTIPDSVTSIGDSAFYNCTSFESVTIPDSVTSIGKYAFYNCTSLESVIISDSVTSIGYEAFYECTSLESITVDSNNKNYSSDEYGVLFNKDKTELIKYPFGNTRTSYTIPDSVTSISKGAFSYCTSLESVTIPDGVTSIGDDAFYYCQSLASITIPDSVTSIGDFAFDDCTSLASITIPDSVTSMGERVFNSTAYYNNESNWENGVLYIGNHLIKAKDTVSGSYAIKDGTKTIAGKAFENCTNLESIAIPDSITSIGNEAFSGCTSLASITIPDSVTSIADFAFEDCKSLTSITVDSNNKNFSSDEYGVLFNKNKTELIQYPIGNTRTSYTIPDNVTSIGDKAFLRCTNLASITFGENNQLTSIDWMAFNLCTSLEDVYYNRTESEWNAIKIGNENECLTGATIHFGHKKPTTDPTEPSTDPTEPSTKPSEPAFKLEIRKPSTTTINYGDSIILHADIEGTLPDDSEIVWTANNGNFDMSVSSDGTTCEITPSSSGDTTFTATVYDKDGNVVSSDTQKMTSKAGLWQKIVAFFKKLFSLNKVIPEVFKGILK